MTLPPNVYRPRPEDWHSAWGDYARPEVYAGDVIELRERLGLSRLGACLGRLGPGRLPCPMHHHLLEEEAFVVLSGRLEVRELADGEATERRFALHEGEAVVYPPGTGLAHQSTNPYAADAVYLCLSSPRNPGEIAYYPDSGKTLIRALGGVGVHGTRAPEEAVSDAVSARATRPVVQLADDARPAHVARRDPSYRELGEGLSGRPITRPAGATELFVNRDRLAPGARTGPLHSHTANTELITVLQGCPTLRQLRDGKEEQVSLQAGDWVAFSAGDGIAHHVLNPSDAEVVLLVIGTDHPEDVIRFPDEGTLHIAATGQTLPWNKTTYFHGEG